jgi:hypothetical protein
MPTKSGAIIINESIPADEEETTLGPYLIGNNISIGVDIVIQNGATGPTTPLVFVIEWERDTDTGYNGLQFLGSTASNGRVPIMNFKIPFDAKQWRVKYTGADTQPVTLTVKYGVYAP